MFPEDGCLHVHDIGEGGRLSTVECPRQNIGNERADGRAPPKIQSAKWSPCGAYRMLTQVERLVPEGRDIRAVECWFSQVCKRPRVLQVNGRPLGRIGSWRTLWPQCAAASIQAATSSATRVKNQLIAADDFDRPRLLNNRDACLYDLSERLKRTGQSTRGGHNYETYNPITPACNYDNMLRSIECRYTRRSGTQRIELHWRRSTTNRAKQRRKWTHRTRQRRDQIN